MTESKVQEEQILRASSLLKDQTGLYQGYFVENLGQYGDDSAIFYCCGNGGSMTFGSTWIDITKVERQVDGEPLVVSTRMVFPGCNPVSPRGEGLLDHVSNFFRGNNPDRWLREVRHFENVVYEDLFDGVDLVFSIDDGVPKYQFEIMPRASVDVIRFAFDGSDGVEVDPVTGDLIIRIGSGLVRDAAPISVQGHGVTATEVISRFTILEDGKVGFSVDEYDCDRTLIIDPWFDYSTFIGSPVEDAASSIVVDDSGCVYVAGTAKHTDFPSTPGAFEPEFSMFVDGFVLKLSPDGSSLIYSTFIGQENFIDEIFGLTIDGSGSAYITGRTMEGGFPTTEGAYCTTFSGRDDTFVLKLNPSGSDLVYSTLLGGDGLDWGQAICVDDEGNAIVTGFAGSGNFPTTDGAFDTTFNGYGKWAYDVFVTKLDPTGSDLVFSTFLGGREQDKGHAICLDIDGYIYVTGAASSPSFPRTSEALNLSSGGVFVTKIHPSGGSLVYSAVLGGGGGADLFIDDRGAAYVIGVTQSNEFPVTSGVFDSDRSEGREGFVLKLSPDAKILEYCSFLGGEADDFPTGLFVDAEGQATVVGWTLSIHFPVTPGAYDTKSIQGDPEVFISVISADGTSLIYSTYVGAKYTETGIDVTVDPEGSVYVVGKTLSGNFPVTEFAFDETHNGHGDVFVFKISDLRLPYLIDDRTEDLATTGDPLTFEVMAGDDHEVVSVTVEYWRENATTRDTQVMERISGDNKSGTWQGEIVVREDTVEPLLYRFIAMDAVDHTNWMVPKTIPVLDNDRPTVVVDRTPLEGTTGDDLKFEVEVFDNIGVLVTTGIYWYGESGQRSETPMVTSDGSIWTMVMTLPSDSVETLHYQVNVTDGAGNSNSTDNRFVTVLDDDAPVMVVDEAPDTIVKGTSYSFGLDIEDNIGVSTVQLEYWFGEEEHEDVSLETGPFRFTLDVPRYPGGDLRYFLSAWDAEANTVESDEFRIPLTNLPPEIAEIPLWSITEEQEATLDLLPYLSDENDDVSNLTLECNDDTITVNGLVLEVLYTKAVPDWTVTLTVSDGEDGTEANLTIHVVNVNDLPVITIVVPANGTEFKKGKTIVLTVNATDEDGDPLNITWEVGGEVLGSGSPFEWSKFSKGEHTITVVVDDGTGVTEERFVVIVKEDEGSPGPGLVATLAAVVLTGLVLARRRSGMCVNPR